MVIYTLPSSSRLNLVRIKQLRRYSSGQRGQTVNLLALAYEGSNPSRRTKIDIVRPEILSTRQYREDATLYIFKNIGVVIDTSGKNYKPLPELFFGPYDNLTGTGA